jgi:ATP-binding cassette subfamily F protein 2
VSSALTRARCAAAQALEEEIMSTVGPDDERLEGIYERLEELDPTTFEVRSARVPPCSAGHRVRVC